MSLVGWQFVNIKEKIAFITKLISTVLTVTDRLIEPVLLSLKRETDFVIVLLRRWGGGGSGGVKRLYISGHHLQG